MQRAGQTSAARKQASSISGIADAKSDAKSYDGGKGSDGGKGYGDNVKGSGTLNYDEEDNDNDNYQSDYKGSYK